MIPFFCQSNIDNFIHHKIRRVVSLCLLTDDLTYRIFLSKCFPGKRFGNDHLVGSCYLLIAILQLERIISEIIRWYIFERHQKRQFPLFFVNGRNFSFIAIRRGHKGIYARYRQPFQIIKILLKQIDIGGCLGRCSEQPYAVFIIIGQFNLTGYGINKMIHHTEAGDAYRQTNSRNKTMNFKVH